jgi:hypothetical protein
MRQSCKEFAFAECKNDEFEERLANSRIFSLGRSDTMPTV